MKPTKWRKALVLNIETLKQAEARFLARYPDGFDNPEIQQIGKKHKMDAMVAFTQGAFSKKAFRDTEKICEDMVKAVGRSSMVSMFEKPKFRDFIKRLSPNEKQFFADALKKLLHGKQEAGLEAMVDLLATEKIAKWSLVSVIPAYFSPDDEVFVKPTTVKAVIKELELAELIYKPRPSWTFYQAYRKVVNEAKQYVDKSLSPSNAAFSGFLMMTLKEGAL